MKKLLVIYLFITVCIGLKAQSVTSVTGKIQDKRTKEALPYVSLGFKNNLGGTTSDFEGHFKLAAANADTLLISYMGYKPLRIGLKKGQSQTLLIELEELTHEIGEVVITPGVNPALRIVDKARKNREQNNQENLSAFEYDSYSKLDLSLTNVSPDMKKNPVFKPLESLFDTLNQMKNAEGKHILPVMVSETFSRYHFKNNPVKTKEIIKANRYSGIGVEKNSYIVDLMGGELHHYNLYNNYVRILNKDFISPIADAAHSFYIYTLLDSSQEESRETYKIQLNLKRKQDLGFEGTIWIDSASGALTKADLIISKETNINFLNRIRMQQEWIYTPFGPWINSKSRIVFDFARFAKSGSGLLASFYNAYSAFEYNQPKPDEFFDYPILTEPGVDKKDSSFWENKRTEPLSKVEKQMYLMVDSVNNLPIVRTYIDIVQTIVEGYRRIGKVDWGPYLSLVSFNQVEGPRFRLGFKTNYDFNPKLILSGYLAYGTRDQKFKYRLGMDYILDSKKWTRFSLSYRNDYDLLGITNSPISSIGNSGVFQFFNFFTSNVRMNSSSEWKTSYTQSFSNYWSLTLHGSQARFAPVGNFNFAFLNHPEKGHSSDNIFESFSHTTVGLEARFAYREKMISRGHDRFRIEASKAPVVVMNYQRGIKNFLNGDFNYHRVNFTLSHRSNLGTFGNADWWLFAGKIWGTLPYPLLDVARGNESFIYSDFNYSLMNFYEFISDQYVHLSYTQRFEGLLLNRIPYIRDLKWRNFLVIKSAYGQLSNSNLGKMSQVDSQGNPVLAVHSFDKGPYVEMGYGIENIFRLLSLGVFHRLNYHELPNARKWGINMGLRVQF